MYVKTSDHGDLSPEGAIPKCKTVTIVSTLLARDAGPLFTFFREDRRDRNTGERLTWFECTKKSILAPLPRFLRAARCKKRISGANNVFDCTVTFSYYSRAIQCESPKIRTQFSFPWILPRTVFLSWEPTGTNIEQSFPQFSYLIVIFIEFLNFSGSFYEEEH